MNKKISYFLIFILVLIIGVLVAYIFLGKTNDNKALDCDKSDIAESDNKTNIVSNMSDEDAITLFDKLIGNWASCELHDNTCSGLIYVISNNRVFVAKLNSDGMYKAYVLSVNKEKENVYKVDLVIPALMCHDCMDGSSTAIYKTFYFDTSNLDNGILESISYLDDGTEVKSKLENAGKTNEELVNYFKNKGDSSMDYLLNLEY